MTDKIHFAESARDERRWESQFDDPKPAPTSEPVPMAENTIPWRDRWKKKRHRTTKRIPGTMHIPNDVGPIDWLE